MVKVEPRSVKNGKYTLYEILATDGNKYSCWDKEYVDALGVGNEVEVEVDISTNGRYTNRTIVIPGQQRRSTPKPTSSPSPVSEENMNKLYAKLVSIEGLILAEVESLKKIEAKLDEKSSEMPVENEADEIPF